MVQLNVNILSQKIAMQIGVMEDMFNTFACFMADTSVLLKRIKNSKKLCRLALENSEASASLELD